MSVVKTCGFNCSLTCGGILFSDCLFQTYCLRGVLIDAASSFTDGYNLV